MTLEYLFYPQDQKPLPTARKKQALLQRLHTPSSITFMMDDCSACNALKSETLHTYIRDNRPALGWSVTGDGGSFGGFLESHRRSALLWAELDLTIAAHAMCLARVVSP